MSNLSNNNKAYKKSKVSKEKMKSFSLSSHMVNFLWNEPFYSRILRSLNKIETETIPTAGVSTKDGDITLYWNREFLAGLSKENMIGLLKHECLHLVFGHTTERKKEPHLIWNYATDLAINSTIPERELPEGGLIPGKKLFLEPEQLSEMSQEEINTFEEISELIASLPRNKTSEYYFNILNKNKSVQKMAAENNIKVFCSGFDEHDGWDDIDEEQKQLIKGKIQEVVKDAIEECNNRSWGTVSGSLKKQIMKMFSNEIKWESLLKRFCGFTKRDERISSMRRLNRKYPGINPGSKKIYKPAIAVYLDESGSISDNEIKKFYAELDNLSNRTDFYLYKFDTKVDEKSCILWKKRKTQPPTRNLSGGTCFESVTEHAAKNKKKFDAYIILTDGCAPKPKPALGIKRCWILASGCELYFKKDKNDILINIK
jgi:predicted metal-dependent peptidase